MLCKCRLNLIILFRQDCHCHLLEAILTVTIVAEQNYLCSCSFITYVILLNNIMFILYDWKSEFLK